MIARVLVNDLEGFATAWRKQKVVTPDVIGNDGEHRAATIGIDDVTCRQVNLRNLRLCTTSGNLGMDLRSLQCLSECTKGTTSVCALLRRL